MSNKDTNKDINKDINNDTVEIKSYVKVEPETKKNKHNKKSSVDTTKKVSAPKVSEPKATTQKSTEQKVTAPKTTTAKATSQKATAQKAAAPKATTQKAATPKATTQKVTEQKTTEQKTTAKKATTQNAAAPKATAPKATEQNVTEAKEVAKKEVAKRELIKEPKELAISAFKILLPVVACVAVIAIIISYIGSRNKANTDENNAVDATFVLSDEPLEENAHEEVNQLMNRFYNALASGDTDTIRELRDYNDDTEILQYEKKSEYIESYDDIVCYTKSGIEDNSYFVYVSYNAKFVGIDTKAPGLNAFFVYPNEDGNLIIDGNMEDDIAAAFKLVTNQEDVVDLYNRIDVNYKEAVSADAELDSMATELPLQIKTAVGEELAQIYAQNAENATEESQEAASTESVSNNTGEITENQTVDQVVKTTDTVNVRSSDSETADKIGKAAVGTELRRTEIKVNGWSKVIFEGKEAYIKSDYLELVSSNDVVGGEVADNGDATATTTETTASGKVKATTNVNIRQQASQTSTKLGTAVAGNTYELLGIEGEWYKINFNGSTGYGKAEYFIKQ
jgi:uncharacterized protein YgiM (DUF1202 family)